MSKGFSFTGGEPTQYQYGKSDYVKPTYTEAEIEAIKAENERLKSLLESDKFLVVKVQPGIDNRLASFDIHSYKEAVELAASYQEYYDRNHSYSNPKFQVSKLVILEREEKWM